MNKLTKLQRKALERIEAYLTGTPFKENSRAKAEVPDLALDYVLDNWVPDGIDGIGAYHTPTEMAFYIQQAVYAYDFQTILDPCAGIGNLVFPFYEEMPITCVELQYNSYRVGNTLMPEMEWIHADAFGWAAHDQRKFDLVLMNPPFGGKAGQYEAEQYTGFKMKSEHQFLALAVNKCIPGGHIAVVAPYNFRDYTAKSRSWFDQKLKFVEVHRSLPGKFLYTNIHVDLHIFERQEDPVEIPVKPVEHAVLPQAVQAKQLDLWSLL